jgi:hypothetical protein
MNPEDPDSQPHNPEPAAPFALPYVTPGPSRPTSITVAGVIGICVAALGLLTSAFGALTTISGIFIGRAMPGMPWQTPGAAAVSISDEVVGLVLAILLLAGSIGLLGLRHWSRRILLLWSWTYLTSVILFLVLQILIVVPSQVAGFNNILRSMPTTGPTTTTSAGGVTTFSYTATASAGPTPAAAAPPMTSGPASAQMSSVMTLTYTITAIVKSAIYLIFPIVLLIIINRQSVREALAPQAITGESPQTPTS